MPLNKYSGAYDDHRPVGSTIPSATLPRGGDGKTIAEIRANAFGRPPEASKSEPRTKRAPRPRKTPKQKAPTPRARKLTDDELHDELARRMKERVLTKLGVARKGGRP